MKFPQLSLNLVFIGLLSFFSFSLPSGAWRPDVVWLVLFARVNNIAFTGIHLSSVFAVSAVCTYLVVRDRAAIAPYKWVAVVFAGAGIHEWLLFFWGWAIFRTPPAAWQDGIWFAAFIALGLAFGNRRQRIVLGSLAVYLGVLMAVYVGYFHDSNLEVGVYTWGATADNLIEVIGWVTTALPFLLVGRQGLAR